MGIAMAPEINPAQTLSEDVKILSNMDVFAKVRQCDDTDYLRTSIRAERNFAKTASNGSPVFTSA